MRVVRAHRTVRSSYGWLWRLRALVCDSGRGGAHLLVCNERWLSTPMVLRGGRGAHRKTSVPRSTMP